ncbi:MAG: hypothetical protein ABW123_00535, partial [Cystobacter sp.]
PRRMALRSLLLSAALVLGGCEREPSPGDGGSADGGSGPVVPPGEPIPDAGSSVGAPRFEHYIRREPYPRMVLEVDGWGGYTPTDSVAQKLRRGLLGLLDKESIEVRVDEAFPGKGADYAWSDAELFRLAEQTGTLEVPVGTIKLHVLLVDGHSARDTQQGKILGLAFPWTHLVLFRQTMDTVCGKGSPLNPCAKVELGVWAHEVGHQLGLVDNGLTMSHPHRDPDANHGRHDSSDKCVMYWAYESSSGLEGLLGLLGEQESLGFDAACRADLDAVKTRP